MDIADKVVISILILLSLLLAHIADGHRNNAIKYKKEATKVTIERDILNQSLKLLGECK